MGRLKQFRGYLRDRRNTLSAIEDRLCSLQEKYERYFQEVSRVRESEFGQLTEHILEDRNKLPEVFNVALDRAEAEVSRQFDQKRKRLRSDVQTLQKKADQHRQRSLKAEQALRKKNVALDQQEEALKERNQRLLQAIADYNRRIKELGKGWGFFANLFKMRGLVDERQTLDQQQQDLAARIEKLRKSWEEVDHKHSQEQKKAREEWIGQQTRAEVLQTKIRYIEESLPRIRLRSTIEGVLFVQTPEHHAPKKDDPPCPRCKSPCPPEDHFCSICAKRLHPDRPDFQGSLAEIAELNLHWQRFSEGMKSCQELIGLVRGLGSGIDAFIASVEEVMESERKYPLPKLEIDVPQRSVKFGKSFDALKTALGEDLSLHPVAFSERVIHLVDHVFTEHKIKEYFETMGQELSRQADKQW